MLSSQELDSDQLNNLKRYREEVEKFIRENFGEEPITRYAGSKAKGTMIAESYDLDIICYFPHDNEMTLKELHDEVERVLSLHYLIERKASAIRIKKKENGVEKDYHIDVVPGKFIEGNSGDAFLHIVYGEKERMQTNIDTHISYITKSKFQDIIKLLKLWKVRNNILPLKTFVLEIFTVKTLNESIKNSNLSDQLKEIFLCLRDQIKNIRLEDPANSNNIVTNALTAVEKNIISSKANDSLTILKDNKDELSAWQKIFDEENINKSLGNNVISNPSKPWCQ